MTGWFRIARGKLHLFAPWKANNKILVSACRRLMLSGNHAESLLRRDELPPNAALCKGCERTVIEDGALKEG